MEFKKLDRLYISAFEAMSPKPDPSPPQKYGLYRYRDGAKPIVWFKGIFWFKHYGIKIVSAPHWQLLGAFRPLTKMLKDFTETGMPYASAGQRARDWWQPVDGLKNVLKGIASLLIGVFALALWSVAASLCLIRFFPSWLGESREAAIVKAQLLDIAKPISWILEGVFNIVRGVTQIVFTPFTYIFKIHFRELLSRNTPPQLAEEKFHIQRLVKESHTLLPKLTGADEHNAYLNEKKLEQVHARLHEINRKYKKSVKDGWATKIKKEEAKKDFVAFKNAMKNISSKARGVASASLTPLDEKETPPVRSPIQQATEAAGQYLLKFSLLKQPTQKSDTENESNMPEAQMTEGAWWKSFYFYGN